MNTVAGDLVLGGDPRFADVEWASCPLAALGCEHSDNPGAKEGWVDEIYDAAAGVEANMSLRDLEPNPTQALIDGVLHLRRETNRLQARLAKERG